VSTLSLSSFPTYMMLPVLSVSSKKSFVCFVCPTEIPQLSSACKYDYKVWETACVFQQDSTLRAGLVWYIIFCVVLLTARNTHGPLNVSRSTDIALALCIHTHIRLSAMSSYLYIITCTPLCIVCRSATNLDDPLSAMFFDAQWNSN